MVLRDQQVAESELSSKALRVAARLLGSDQQAPTPICTDQSACLIFRIERGHRWQIYDLYASPGNRCGVER